MDETKNQPKGSGVGIIGIAGSNIPPEDILRIMLSMIPPGSTADILTPLGIIRITKTGAASPEEEAALREALANGSPMEQEALTVATEASSEKEIADFLQKYDNMPFEVLALLTHALPWGPGMIAFKDAHNKAYFDPKDEDPAERIARDREVTQRLSHGTQKEQSILMVVKNGSEQAIRELMKFYNMTFEELQEMTEGLLWGEGMRSMALNRMAHVFYEGRPPIAQA